ncbi:MAG: hypothetical protein ACLSFI_09550 [Christensenellaceae bacterium]
MKKIFNAQKRIPFFLAAAKIFPPENYNHEHMFPAAYRDGVTSMASPFVQLLNDGAIPLIKQKKISKTKK